FRPTIAVMSAAVNRPARSSGRAAVRWLHQRFVDAVTRLDAKAVMDIASAAGRLSAQLRGRPRPADVAAVLAGHPALASLDPVRIACEAKASTYRARALLALARRRGLDAVVPLLEREGIGPLQSLATPGVSAVVVTWHFGAGCGLSAAFHRYGIRGWALTRNALPAEHASVSLRVGRDGDDRARALWRAINLLKDEGGVIVVAADGMAGERTRPVPLLGRQARLSRGPFVLARLTGAPLVPVVATWTAARTLKIVVGRPLVVDAPRTDVDAFETAAARAAAAWMEDRIVAMPSDLRPHIYRALASSPRV